MVFAIAKLRGGVSVDFHFFAQFRVFLADILLVDFAFSAESFLFSHICPYSQICYLSFWPLREQYIKPSSNLFCAMHLA